MPLNFLGALKAGLLICFLKIKERYLRIQIILACTGLCQQRKNREQLSTIFSNFPRNQRVPSRRLKLFRNKCYSLDSLIIDHSLFFFYTRRCSGATQSSMYLVPDNDLCFCCVLTLQSAKQPHSCACK